MSRTPRILSSNVKILETKILISFMYRMQLSKLLLPSVVKLLKKSITCSLCVDIFILIKEQPGISCFLCNICVVYSTLTFKCIIVGKRRPSHTFVTQIMSQSDLFMWIGHLGTSGQIVFWFPLTLLNWSWNVQNETSSYRNVLYLCHFIYFESQKLTKYDWRLHIWTVLMLYKWYIIYNFFVQI